MTISVYSSNTHILIKSSLSKIQKVEMKFLNLVKDCTRADHISNTFIRVEFDSSN